MSGICEWCGSALGESANICSQCGTKVGPAEATTEAPSREEATPSEAVTAVSAYLPSPRDPATPGELHPTHLAVAPASTPAPPPFELDQRSGSMSESRTSDSDTPSATNPGVSSFRRHRLAILLSVVILVLSVVAGWALYGMHTNAAHARSWQRRAEVLQADETQLQSLLSARSRLLNQRIDQVNDLAGKLRSSQVALGKSQGDVSSLEVRQRALANEKAQLQDQQAALHQVVNSFVTCQGDLVSVVSDLAASYDPTYDFQIAETDCGGADDAFRAYLNNWPNG